MHRSKHTLAEQVNAIRFLGACSRAYGLDSDRVINAVPRLADICTANHLNVEDLPLDTERKAAELKKLEEERSSLEEQLTELGSKHEELLKKAQKTEEDLARFKALAERLAKRGLPPDAPEKLENALANADAAGYDAGHLVDLISSADSLVEKHKKLAEQTAQIEADIKRNTALMQMQAAAMARNSEQLAKLEKCKRKTSASMN